MTKRIFRSIAMVALAVFCASFILIIGILHGHFSNIQKSQLRAQALLAAQGVSHEGEKYFKNLDITESRITWISRDGTVLFDSRFDPQDMENHSDREEFLEALQDGSGESLRFSSSTMRHTLYCTQRLDDGSVIRLSISQDALFTTLIGMLQPICIIILLAILSSLILASQLARKIVEPLNRLNLDNPLANTGYDEISPLLRRIDLQQNELNRQKNTLKRKSDEFEAVTGSMNEGLLLINDNGTVLSINKAARKILDISGHCIGKDIVSINHSEKLNALIYHALGGSCREAVVTLGEGTYQINATPVISEKKISGAVLLIFNVTEKENAEKMRREFTANVSHELKTPLHSISGYAELIKTDLARPDDIRGFSEKIYYEAQRMIRLVEDIIRLSRLDEGMQDLVCEDVELYSISEEVVSSLEPAAELAWVSLSLSGCRTVIPGVAQHIRAIVYNLCDNAIKYNRPQGSVHIEISETPAHLTLSVKDSGIGIPPEHHSRIFERFYSVDRSHSKAIGGTGLGLSIVKHAAKIHNAKIDLESRPGIGTCVSVHFPKST